MEDVNTSKARAFDISEIDSVEEAEMEILANGRPTDWKWRFAGPSHPWGIAQSTRLSRASLGKRRLQEQQQLNGKKIKVSEQTPDEVLEDNVNFVLERLLGWSEITMNGEPYPFNDENARRLLMDRKKGALLQQAIEFILDDNSFMQRSAKQ